uniref:Proteasome inhibitor PI31 subunit n=1 Tax=Maconellicoccus hirsutus TaxID=177089 RepID=A2I453_MACHI|nr:hypothetical protein [Maconellicoccus hirsutus]
MGDKFFGWELLVNNVKNDINKKEDVLTLLVHFSLIKAGFKCVGINDDWKAEEVEISTELLPKEWNAGKEYVFRYRYKDEKFVLRSCHSDQSTIIFNLMQTEKLKVANVMFNYEKSVDDLKGNISSVLPNHKELSEVIQRDLLSSFIDEVKKNVDTQTNPAESPFVLIPLPDRSRSDPPFNIEHIRPLEPFARRDLDPLAAVGRRDLDPLAAVGSGNPLRVGGGGMIFDPLQENRSRFSEIGPVPGPGVPRGLPRGAVPPGARYDPFGPPGPNPGPDRFPPEYDDMFS